MIDYSVATRKARVNQLIQTLSCLGEYGATLDMIAHDFGFSKPITEYTIRKAQIFGEIKIRKEKDLYFYED